MKVTVGLLCLAAVVPASGIAQVGTRQSISVTITGVSASWNCAFEATSFSFDVDRGGSIGPAGASFNTFNTKVTLGKVMDPCSAVLAKAIFLGEHYTTVKIRVTQSGSTPATLYRVFTLTNVVWSAKSADYPNTVDIGVGSPQSVNLETLTLNYQTITIGDPLNQIQYGFKLPSDANSSSMVVPPAPCSTTYCS